MCESKLHSKENNAVTYVFLFQKKELIPRRCGSHCCHRRSLIEKYPNPCHYHQIEFQYFFLRVSKANMFCAILLCTFLYLNFVLCFYDFHITDRTYIELNCTKSKSNRSSSVSQLQGSLWDLQHPDISFLQTVLSSVI